MKLCLGEAEKNMIKKKLKSIRGSKLKTRALLDPVFPVCFYVLLSLWRSLFYIVLTCYSKKFLCPCLASPSPSSSPSPSPSLSVAGWLAVCSSNCSLFILKKLLDSSSFAEHRFNLFILHLNPHIYHRFPFDFLMNQHPENPSL